MAIPLLAGLAMGGQALGGLAQLIGGGRKRRRAEKAYADSENFANQTLDLIQSQPDIGMASEQYDAGRRNIDRTQSGGLRALQNLGGGSALKGISNLVQAGSDAGVALDVQDALMKQKNRQLKLSQILGQRGLLQQMKQAKFAGEAGAAEAETGAGLQNIFGALSSTAQLDALSGLNNGTDNSTGNILGGLFGKRNNKRMGGIISNSPQYIQNYQAGDMEA